MNKSNINWVGMGLILGVGIGATLGIIYSNMALFAAFGAGVGIVIGAIIASYESKN
jgi:hypothetical protein